METSRNGKTAEMHDKIGLYALVKGESGSI